MIEWLKNINWLMIWIIYNSISVAMHLMGYVSPRVLVLDTLISTIILLFILRKLEQI